jgi:hypothetical protein
MATKPSEIPTWATTPADATHVVQPSAGKRLLGWQPGERPGCEYLNYDQNLLGDWCQYLSDGALTGNHSIAGTLSTTGACTLGGTVSAAGLITATGGVTCAANQDVTVSGTGDFVHGDKVRVVGLANAYYSGSVAWDDGNVEAAASGVGFLAVEVPFLVGDRIKTATARAHGNAATTVTVSLSITDGSGGTVAAVNNGGQVLSGAYQTTAATESAATTLTADMSVRAYITWNGGASAAQSIAITFDHP